MDGLDINNVLHLRVIISSLPSFVSPLVRSITKNLRTTCHQHQVKLLCIYRQIPGWSLTPWICSAQPAFARGTQGSLLVNGVIVSQTEAP